MKEEHVAGAHGIEARYPFLDAAVVQEYLWLTAAAKNAASASRAWAAKKKTKLSFKGVFHSILSFKGVFHSIYCPGRLHQLPGDAADGLPAGGLPAVRRESSVQGIVEQTG